MNSQPTPKRVSPCDDVRQAIFLACDRVRLAVKDREPHPAGDVDADRVWDDSVLRRQYAADRQAVTDMGIGHERSGHRDRQRAGVGHLLNRLRLEIVAPLTPRCGFCARQEFRLNQRARQIPSVRVVVELLRVGDESAQLRFDRRAIEPTREKLAQERVRQLQRATTGNTEIE